MYTKEERKAYSSKYYLDNKDKILESNRSKSPAKILTVENMFSKRRASAKQHNHIWDITLNQFTYLLSKGCFITNCVDRVTGLDRIDCSIGYIFSNVRPSCKRHNVMRNDMPDGEFYKKAKEVTSWYESKFKFQEDRKSDNLLATKVRPS
jgi:hypothetical protein